MWNPLNAMTPLTATATGTTSATAFIAAVTGVTYYLVDISCSADNKSASLVINDGTTAKWQDNISGQSAPAPCWYSRSFFAPIRCSKNASVNAVVTNTGGSVCNVNIAVFRQEI